MTNCLRQLYGLRQKSTSFAKFHNYSIWAARKWRGFSGCGGVRHVGECSSCIGQVVVVGLQGGVISELGRLRLLRQIRAFLIPVLQWAVEYKCNTKGLRAREDQLFLGRLVVAFKVF